MADASAALEKLVAGRAQAKAAERVRVALRAQLKGLAVRDLPTTTLSESKPNWYVTVEAKVDPRVVPSESLQRSILDTGLPWRVTDRVTGVEFVLIPPGVYRRGASDDDHEAAANERPAHLVQITKPFYLGRYESTCGEFQQFEPTWVFIGTAWRQKFDARLPITSLSVETIERYCRGFRFRLPSQAEWEWACRAGCSAPRYGDLRAIAWTAQDGHTGTHAVGLKKPNGLGLYDMLGNVWECASDRPAKAGYARYGGGAEPVADPIGVGDGDSFRVCCGGCWGNDAQRCRASSWDWLAISAGGDSDGFRVVHDV